MAETGPVMLSVSVVVKAHEGVSFHDIKGVLRDRQLLKQMMACGVCADKGTLTIRGTDMPITDLENGAKIHGTKPSNVQFGDTVIVFVREHDHSNEEVHDMNICSATFKKLIDEHKEEKEKRKQSKLAVQ